MKVDDLDMDDIVIVCVIGDKHPDDDSSDSTFSSVMGPTGSGKSTVRQMGQLGFSSFTLVVVRMCCKWA